jgi:hypothetical protein
VLEVSYAAFRCMLLFIYGGAVHVPEELAVELLGLADRYLLAGLKQLCGFTLEKMIAVDTVARIIQAAERWDAAEGQLKTRCMEYILTNYEAVRGHARRAHALGSTRCSVARQDAGLGSGLTRCARVAGACLAGGGPPRL